MLGFDSLLDNRLTLGCSGLSGGGVMSEQDDKSAVEEKKTAA